MIKKGLQSVIAIAFLIIGHFLLREDYISFLQWWMLILILGIIFMPTASILFRSFFDKGYLFSKVIGIAVIGYLIWLASSLHIMRFSTTSCIIIVILGLVLNLIVLWYQRKNKIRGSNPFDISFQEIFASIVWEEIIFFALFLVFTYIRGFKPEAHGTEKFMDFGFMSSMMRSDYMPPQDLWFSGTKLNYYYVGQYIATVLTKLSFLKVSYGYNLMLMMSAAFTMILPYSLVSNIFLTLWTKRNIKNHILSRFSGVTAGLAVCIAGNMHYTVFRWLEPAVRWFFGMEQNNDEYWFPDATRYIGYHPETSDKTIHEFPAYSFVLGDLHAHVINIMFVLTVLAILFAWLKNREKGCEKTETIPIWKEVFQPSIVAITFFIGLFHMTNFWDFPIYYVVSGAVILFSNMIVYNFKGKALWLTALQGIFVLVGAVLFCLPFRVQFDQISAKPCLAVAHTPLNQLIVLWGLPVVMTLSFLCFLIADCIKRQKKMVDGNKENKRTIFVRFMQSLSGSDLFIVTIGLCAIGLVLLPEIIYIEDIYSGDYKRANTMFKLTYQAFIMFGLTFGYLFFRLSVYGRTWRQKKTAIIGALLFLSSVFYIGNAVDHWYGNVFKHSGYQGIDATAFLEEDMPDDALAIEWLNENVTGMEVVLEANGDSYTDYQRVSVFTGLPTVLGWRTHEWLWKSDTTQLDVRTEDIRTIYTSDNLFEVQTLIEQYQISYIYVGNLEQEKYENLNHQLIKQLGEVVFISPMTTDKSYETYIIRVR